jgi:hypothetical protein
VSLGFIPTDDLEQGFLPFEAGEDEHDGAGDAGERQWSKFSQLIAGLLR